MLLMHWTDNKQSDAAETQNKVLILQIGYYMTLIDGDVLTTLKSLRIGKCTYTRFRELQKMDGVENTTVESYKQMTSASAHNSL